MNVSAVTAARRSERSAARRRLGRFLTTLPLAFLAFDSLIKLVGIDPVLRSFEKLGYSASVSTAVGLIEATCLALFAFPRTVVLGALLLTGYLGGAVATHFRVGDPLLTHVLFPVYVGLFLWVGLILRERRLETLLPLRRRLDAEEEG